MSVASYVGILLAGLALVWCVPAFRADATFWVPAFAAVQVWFSFFVRAGRTSERARR